MLHIPGFLKLCSSRNPSSGRANGERNGQLEGRSARQCAFEDLQRCANSRLNVAWQCSHYSLLFPCGNRLRNKPHAYLLCPIVIAKNLNLLFRLILIKKWTALIAISFNILRLSAIIVMGQILLYPSWTHFLIIKHFQPSNDCVIQAALIYDLHQLINLLPVSFAFAKICLSHSWPRNVVS